MNCTTVYVGLDVHKETFSLCCYTNEKEKPEYPQKIEDAALIARCLAHHDYSAVHIPTEHDEQVKEYIRMRQDHKLALKKVKQQILSFCLRHNYCFNETSHHWTAAHLKLLRALKPGNIYQEILEEYLLTFDNLTDKLERLDKRIEELAADKGYKEKVSRLSCFHGVKTQLTLTRFIVCLMKYHSLNMNMSQFKII